MIHNELEICFNFFLNSTKVNLITLIFHEMKTYYKK